MTVAEQTEKPNRYAGLGGVYVVIDGERFPADEQGNPLPHTRDENGMPLPTPAQPEED